MSEYKNVYTEKGRRLLAGLLDFSLGEEEVWEKAQRYIADRQELFERETGRHRFSHAAKALGEKVDLEVAMQARSRHEARDAQVVT